MTLKLSKAIAKQLKLIFRTISLNILFISFILALLSLANA